MFCANCGGTVSDGIKYCPKCGAMVGALSAQSITNGDCSPSSFSLFSFSGRVTRARWWGTNICIYVGAFLVGFVGGVMLLTGEDTELFLGCIPYSCLALILVVGVIATVLSLSVDVRRFHDINMSGWMLVLFWALSFVPLVGTIAWIIKLFMLAFVDGTMGPNRYGADPKGRQSPFVSQVVVNVVGQNQLSV